MFLNSLSLIFSIRNHILKNTNLPTERAGSTHGVRVFLLFCGGLAHNAMTTKKQQNICSAVCSSFVGETGFEGRSRKLRPRGDNQDKAQAESRAIEITLSPQPYIKEYQPSHRKSRWHAHGVRGFLSFCGGLAHNAMTTKKTAEQMFCCPLQLCRDDWI